jgi:hypothetical protein
VGPPENSAYGLGPAPRLVHLDVARSPVDSLEGVAYAPVLAHVESHAANTTLGLHELPSLLSVNLVDVPNCYATGKEPETVSTQKQRPRVAARDLWPRRH